MGEWMYISTILDLGTTWSFELHVPVTLPWGDVPRYPMANRLDEPKSRSGRCGEEEHLVTLPGIEPQPSNPKPAAMPSELSRITGRLWKQTVMTYFKVTVLTYDWKGGIKWSKYQVSGCRMEPGSSPVRKMATFRQRNVLARNGLLSVLHCHMCRGIGDSVWWSYLVNVTCHFVCIGMLNSICWTCEQWAQVGCADVSGQNKIHPIFTGLLTQSIKWKYDWPGMCCCLVARI
jgi:hypothetical protein